MSTLNVLPAILLFFVWIAMLGMGVYSFVLFIKLARRGIKALDIYISEKENGKLQ